MFADRKVQPRSLTDGEIEAAVADSVARSKARRSGSAESDHQPNYALRRVALGAGLGFAAVLATLAVRMGIGAHDRDALNAKLSQPLPDVAAEIKEGDIDVSDVTRFRVGDNEYAWSVASDLTHRDHQLDTADVSSIIQAQQGNPVEAGSTVVVPDSAIDHPIEP